MGGDSTTARSAARFDALAPADARSRRSALPRMDRACTRQRWPDADRTPLALPLCLRHGAIGARDGTAEWTDALLPALQAPFLSTLKNTQIDARAKSRAATGRHQQEVDS